MPTFTDRPTAAVSKFFHIPSLDGIRGIAFLLVFFSHAGLKYVVPGGFGVTIFFLLSGFLITTLLRLEFAETGKIDLKAFYLRRTFRILPLYYVVLLAALILQYFGQTSGCLRLDAILSQVVNWSNFFMIKHTQDAVAGGTIVFWSLAVEEHFYLLFPLLFGWMSRHLSKKATVAVLSAACLACLLWRYFLIYGVHASDQRTECGTDTRFDCLLFGCIMAIAFNPVIDKRSWFSPSCLKVLAPLALVLLLFTFLFRNDGFRFTTRFTLQSIALLPLFLYAILSRGSLVYQALNSRLMVKIGLLSYALYLVHALILDWFSIHLHAGQVVIAAATLAAAFAAAQLLHITVERPFQTLRKRYSRVKQPSALKSAAPAPLNESEARELETTETTV